MLGCCVQILLEARLWTVIQMETNFEQQNKPVPHTYEDDFECLQIVWLVGDYSYR